MYTHQTKLLLLSEVSLPLKKHEVMIEDLTLVQATAELLKHSHKFLRILQENKKQKKLLCISLLLSQPPNQMQQLGSQCGGRCSYRFLSSSVQFFLRTRADLFATQIVHIMMMMML
jgi:hypothetical protein